MNRAGRSFCDNGLLPSEIRAARSQNDMGTMLLICTGAVIAILLALFLYGRRAEGRLLDTLAGFSARLSTAGSQAEGRIASVRESLLAAVANAREELSQEAARAAEAMDRKLEHLLERVTWTADASEQHFRSVYAQMERSFTDSRRLSEEALAAHRGELEARLKSLEQTLDRRSDIAALEETLHGLSARLDAFEQSLDVRADLAEVREGVSELGAGRHEVREEIAAVRRGVQELSDAQRDYTERLARAEREIRAEIADARQAYGERLAELDVHAELAALRIAFDEQKVKLESFEALLPKPERNPPPCIEIEGRSEPELLAIARQLRFVRPLVPYPKWRFDADWANPDFAFEMRRSIWDHFRAKPRGTPLVIDWTEGLRLNVYLGNDSSKQIFISGCIEPNEFAFLGNFLERGMHFLDAGANEGIYSLFASRKVGAEGAVWAFEPSEREFRRLEDNLSLNNLANVHPFQMALAERDDKCPLTIADDEHSGQNTLGAFAYDAVRALRVEEVSVRRLDALVEELGIERLDVIKLDVEGAEHRALLGARETLREFRPVILFEASDDSLGSQKSSRANLCALLAAQSYCIYAFGDSTGLPVPAAGRQFSDNLIAVPVEKPLPARVFSAIPSGEVEDHDRPPGPS